jgi:hypothetical protein
VAYLAVGLMLVLLWRMERLMAISQQILDLLARGDAATSAMAARIQKLIEAVGTGMSEQDVEALKAALGAEADKLDALGKDPANPV